MILLVDALRADRLGTYGYSTRPTSPFIDELARESVVFEDASAAAPWTLPSLASLFTSTFLCEHALINDRDRLPQERTTLAEHLKELGLATLSFSGNPYAGRDFGLAQGFDRLIESRATDTATLTPLLEPAARGRLFLYVHLMDPHGGERFSGPAIEGFPAEPPELRKRLQRGFESYRRLTRKDFAESQQVGSTDNTDEQLAALALLDQYREENQVLYDAAVRLADRRVKAVVEVLRALEMWDDTLLILLADHGEALGDHGGWQHDHSTYQELLHVPLMAHFPGGQPGGVRVSQLVSLVDVAPTILDAMGASERTTGMRGRSLLPLLRDSSAARTWPEERIVGLRINQKKYFRPWKETRGDVNIAVRRGSLKGIWNQEVGSFELYDLAVDPGETRDLGGERRELAMQLEIVARTWFDGCLAAGPGETVISGLDMISKTLTWAGSLPGSRPAAGISA